jgi:hypothetical protein
LPRKRIELDLDELEKLAKLQSTHADVAAWFGVSETLVRNRLKEAKYLAVWDSGKGKGRVSLRRAQMQTALGKSRSAATMQIWLGKQYLGQREGDDSGADAAKCAIVELMDRLRAGA